MVKYKGSKEKNVLTGNPEHNIQFIMERCTWKDVQPNYEEDNIFIFFYILLYIFEFYYYYYTIS